ncbi:hypothetical protein MRX96_013702 [Rhipicephalus microplus]
MGGRAPAAKGPGVEPRRQIPHAGSRKSQSNDAPEESSCDNSNGTASSGWKNNSASDNNNGAVTVALKDPWQESSNG